MGNEYLKRVVDSELEGRLKRAGAVLIEGAKWCGKTRTAKEYAASTVRMQDPASIKAADVSPSAFLKGGVPRLIDEWQVSPAIWDAVRFEVDDRGQPGQFILTGSAVPPEDPSRHSGAGRMSRLLMRPMSLYESMESSGSVSLKGLFDGADVEAVSEMSIDMLALALVRGGWPASIGDDEKTASGKMQDYLDVVINTDVSRVDGIRRDPTAVRKLMASLSRNTSAAANMSTIRKDMAGDNDAISDKTVSSYINALRRIFVVEDVEAWNPSVRSKTSVRTSPKRHFVDPSIAASVLRMSTGRLLKDFNTFGLLFESLCVRDLRVYSQAMGGEVLHYRDSYGLEADAILHLRDGRWAAVEIKMGTSEIDMGAKNLLKLRDSVDQRNAGPPSFLMVLTAGEYGYRRKDGVYVVPIGSLKD
ncbi:MAG: ATP-binding protein [Candidatus Methanoplasma sp.]|nr:ATP-binding protein [Candidatus Methanoplasma sp.]